jgi:hypothetical protein
MATIQDLDLVTAYGHASGSESDLEAYMANLPTYATKS